LVNRHVSSGAAVEAVGRYPRQTQAVRGRRPWREGTDLTAKLARDHDGRSKWGPGLLKFFSQQTTKGRTASSAPASWPVRPDETGFPRGEESKGAAPSVSGAAASIASAVQ
jgi:hypothetical protein